MKQSLKEVTIEIVQKCANNCIFCSSLSKKTARHIISKENCFSIGGQAKKLGLKRISISGGEPLLHPNIFDIISYYIHLELKINLYTTGIVLDELNKSVPFTRWNELNKNDVRLIFGIQSTVNTIHDKITRNTGSLDITKKSLFKAKDNGFETEVHIVPNKSNLFTLEKSVHDLIEWGVDQISFLRLVPQGLAKNNINLLLFDSRESDVLKNILLKLSAETELKTKLRIGIPFSGVINEPKKCNAGETKLIIRFDGKVLPCEAFKDLTCSSYILGDIKYDSLEEIILRSSENIHLSCLKSNTDKFETCPAQLLYR